jgi:nickel-dependent lactate racemase
MKAMIPYLDEIKALELPDDSLIVEPNEAEGAIGSLPGDIVREALAHPLWGSSTAFSGLSGFLAGGKDVVVIVNDATRPTPTAAMLGPMADDLDAAGASFIVATGAHRAPTEEEYRFILGEHYERFRARTIAHDARDASSLVDRGKTRNGTPILLNRAVVEADRVIVLGSVEPHYFAGYTGGRKAFLPGVAGYATIEANHRLALDPRAAALELADNPVSQDMEDALRFIPERVFAVMAVLDKRQRLSAVRVGDLRASFEAAVVKAKSIFAVDLESAADIVVSVAKPPMDIDLYQSQKAIENGSLAVKDGGCLILVSSCRDGVGDEAYIKLLASEAEPEAVLRRISQSYRLGWHKAGKIARVAMRVTIMAVSELDAGLLAQAFIEKQPSIQAAVDEALRRFAASSGGKTARLILLPDGTVTVPRISKR